MTITIEKTKELPIDPTYSNFFVGHPTFITDYSVLIKYLNYYLTQNVSHFIEESIPYLAGIDTIQTSSLIFQYKKSSGVTTVRFELEPQINYSTDFEAPKSFYCVLSMPSGAKFINGAPQPFATASTSSPARYEIALSTTSSAERNTYGTYVDVSALNSSSLYAFTASFYSIKSNTSASAAIGPGTFRGYEIPRKVIVTSSNNIGYFIPEDMRPIPIVDLSTPNPTGIKSLVREIERLKNEIPNQFNLSFVSESYDYLCLLKYYSTVSGAFTYGSNTNSPSAANRSFFLRTNNTYGTGSAGALSSSYNLSVVYGTKTLGKYDFYLKYRASGSTDWSEKRLSLSPSTTLKYRTDEVFLPTTGSYGIVECFVDAKAYNDPSALLKVYNIHLIENNS